MVTLHVVSIYQVPDGLMPNELHRECDILMAELLRLETMDERVRDATVSTDLRRHRIEVEVESTADVLEHAASAAHLRISAASAVLTIPAELMELHVEVI